MKIHKIYIDMDGVLADFDRGVLELCHQEPVPQGRGTPEQEAMLWAGVRSVPHFYGQLKPKEGAVDFFLSLEQQYGDRVEILTGIPKPHKHVQFAAEDKTEWVHRYLSDHVVINIVYRVDKPKFCTGPGDILIDDYDKNIREWEKCGGTGILFTNPGQVMEELGRLAWE